MTLGEEEKVRFSGREVVFLRKKVGVKAADVTKSNRKCIGQMSRTFRLVINLGAKG